MHIDAIESPDKCVVHQGHVRGDVDNGIIELEGRVSPRREGARLMVGGVLRGALTLFSLPGVSKSLKGWSAQTPSGICSEGILA